MNYKFMLAAVTCTISAICVSLAQQNKEVEVTKAYIPKIEPTSKMTLIPDMVDTVRIEPDIDYTVTPLSIATSLATTPFKPATVTYWEFNRPKQYYAKVGAGYPLNSLVDIYASTHNPSVGYLMGYINHNGRYSQISNDYSIKNSSQQVHTSAGVAAGTYIGMKRLEGELIYNNDLWSRYATLSSRDEHPLYNDFGLNIRFGDSFTDFSRWNFGLDGQVGYFSSRSDFSNTYLGAKVDMGKGVGNGRFFASLGYDYVGANVNYDNNSFTLGLSYEIDLYIMRLKAGGRYVYDGINSADGDSSRSYFLPDVSLDFGSNHAFTPFIKIDGELQRGDYGSLTDINPYVLAGSYGRLNSVDYTIGGGVKGGDKSAHLLYKLYFDYGYALNNLFWIYNTHINYYDSQYGVDNYYSFVQGNLQSYTFGLDLTYKPMAGLTLDASAYYARYSVSSSVGCEVGKPDFEVDFEGRYDLSDWSFMAGAEVMGEREWSASSSLGGGGVYTASTSVNIKAAVDYKLNKSWSLFLEGDNLACADIYNWGGYREYGINFTVGAKVQF